MGILSTILIYRLGRRGAVKQRDRQERRERFREEWNNTKTISDDGEWEPADKVWRPDPREWQPLDGSE